jgi:hypothetical protein
MRDDDDDAGGDDVNEGNTSQSHKYENWENDLLL